jgi:ribosomal protein S18 acetylase RimI-like enzyme
VSAAKAPGREIICGVAEEITFALQQTRPIEPGQLRKLYLTADWGHNRDEPGIQTTIDASVALGAWDGERLVGFVRALSDGRYRAYIEDVIVDPEYRGRQVGERMVAEMVSALGDIEIVSLFCLPERVAFYERNGFVPQRTQVMMHRRADVP